MSSVLNVSEWRIENRPEEKKFFLYHTNLPVNFEITYKELKEVKDAGVLPSQFILLKIEAALEKTKINLSEYLAKHLDKWNID